MTTDERLDKLDARMWEIEKKQQKIYNLALGIAIGLVIAGLLAGLITISDVMKIKNAIK